MKTAEWEKVHAALLRVHAQYNKRPGGSSLSGVSLSDLATDLVAELVDPNVMEDLERRGFSLDIGGGVIGGLVVTCRTCGGHWHTPRHMGAGALLTLFNHAAEHQQGSLG